MPEILDNSTEKYQLKTFLSEELASGKYSEFSVATGYWDLPGFGEVLMGLKDFLNKSPEGRIRLLIGEEPKVRIKETDKTFPEGYISLDLRELAVTEPFQETADFLMRELETGRIEVRLYKRGFLHAKCYILGSETEEAKGIIGSSNFTRNGLIGNTELNDVEIDYRVVNYRPMSEQQDPSHRSWFDAVWNDELNVAWNQQFRMEVLGLSQFGSETYSPYEMYIRILYEIYGKDLEFEGREPDEDGRESRVDLVSFQTESAAKVMDRLNNPRIGMCLVGDSVGLGKSFIAKKVIEDFGYYRRQNVVVICPASLRDDWKKHLDDITVTAPVYSISEIASDQSFEQIQRDLLLKRDQSKRDNAIDLLVIDESHNLKTQGAKSFQHLLELISPLGGLCKKLPKVLMLSATPVNNSINDLANQILLAKGSNDSFFTAVGIPSIYDLFTNTQKSFRRLGSEEVFGDLYPILNKIMVKRTRHQVKRDFPNALMNGERIIFPDERLENLLYQLDSKEIRNKIAHLLKELEHTNESLYLHFTEELNAEQDEQIERQGVIEFFQYHDQSNRRRLNQVEYESLFHFVDRAIHGLNLSPYSYLTQKRDKSPAEEIEANSRNNLTGVVRVSLFKSFDSSIYTFTQRIKKYKTFLLQFEQQFFDGKRVVRPGIISKAIARQIETPDADLETLIEEEIGKTEQREAAKAAKDSQYVAKPAFRMVEHEEYNIDILRTFIQQDKDILELIQTLLSEIKGDSKLDLLKQQLGKLRGKKVLIFSYFATTLDYLKDQLDSDFLKGIGIEAEEIAFLRSRNRDQKQEFVERFAPLAQKQVVTDGNVNGKPELKLLISTDVLSEGQNLQDCGTIINYDLHWNPVKMIQRNGRINRLGSKFPEVFVYNFRPEDQLDRFLNLMRRLQEKITMIGASVGLDSSVLGEQITPREFGLIERIYSDNPNEQREAIEELERENDLAFDEAFESDLRAWMRKASDEEKVRLLNMNFNKWCGLASVEKKEHLMAFCTGKGEFSFILEKEGKVREEENRLKALRTVRSFDTQRQKEKISHADKKALTEAAEKVFASQAAQNDLFGEDGGLSEFMGVSKTGAGAALSAFKVELLRLLNDNLDRYSDDNVNRLRKLLTSNSISLDNRLRTYLKHNQYQISMELLDMLALLSENMVQNVPVGEVPKPELWFGYYGE